MGETGNDAREPRQSVVEARHQDQMGGGVELQEQKSAVETKSILLILY